MVVTLGNLTPILERGRQSADNGHDSGAIGMAAIGVALWKYVMRYAPHSPDFFNRDRFVLSNGNSL